MPRLLKLFILIFSFSLLVFRFSNPVISQPQFPPVDKNKVVDLANRWFGNQPLGHHRVNEYFDTILNQSIAAGIDPGIESVLQWPTIGILGNRREQTASQHAYRIENTVVLHIW